MTLFALNLDRPSLLKIGKCPVFFDKVLVILNFSGKLQVRGLGYQEHVS